MTEEERITLRCIGHRFWGTYSTPYQFNITVNEFAACKAHKDKFPTKAAVTCESALAVGGYYRICLTKNNI